jgi:IS605 OrfB family transposase
MNHIISKRIVSLPYDVISLEELNTADMKENGQGKRFRKMLGSWSPFELQRFIEYEAQDKGKMVIYVDPSLHHKNALNAVT